MPRQINDAERTWAWVGTYGRTLHRQRVPAQMPLAQRSRRLLGDRDGAGVAALATAMLPPWPPVSKSAVLEWVVTRFRGKRDARNAGCPGAAAGRGTAAWVRGDGCTDRSRLGGGNRPRSSPSSAGSAGRADQTGERLLPHPHHAPGCAAWGQAGLPRAARGRAGAARLRWPPRPRTGGGGDRAGSDAGADARGVGGGRGRQFWWCGSGWAARPLPLPIPVALK